MYAHSQLFEIKKLSFVSLFQKLCLNSCLLCYYIHMAVINLLNKRVVKKGSSRCSIPSELSEHFDGSLCLNRNCNSQEISSNKNEEITLVSMCDLVLVCSYMCAGSQRESICSVSLQVHMKNGCNMKKKPHTHTHTHTHTHVQILSLCFSLTQNVSTVNLIRGQFI